jgi:cell division protein FtsW
MIVGWILDVITPPNKDYKEISSLSPQKFIEKTAKSENFSTDYSSFFSYKDKIVKKAIWLLKYKRHKDIGVLLGKACSPFFEEKLENFTNSKSNKEAERWLRIGGNTFQPSELVKITIIVYLAAWIERKKDILHDFYNGLLPGLLVVGLIAVLILSQPDFGTMFMILAISALMLFMGGVPLKYMASGLVLLSIVLYLFIHFEPYRAQRLVAFLNPEIDPRGISYQVNQSILAIGAGGPLGYGYGMSRQKYNYLPASYTDSIFAVTSEELGLWGGSLILLVFCYFCLIGLKISKNAPDVFGEMLAVGVTSWITIQALVNIGALTGVLPLTGIPLPFFSYGSTALIANLAAIGILLNISKQS